jgi:hypothetical protein
MSITAVTYPMSEALVKAEEMKGVGVNRQWKAVNDEQSYFLKVFFDICREEIGKIPEIESIASWHAEEINAFLRQRGFTIQLDPFDPQTFGVASVLDLLVEWQEKGEVTTVHGVDGKRYPGVKINENNVVIFSSRGHDNPVAQLKTKNGDRVFMTVLDKAPRDGFDLIAKAEAISARPTAIRNGSELLFPMVDLNQRVDISWLKGMHTVCEDGDPLEIVQALQQTILKMNEVGARAQSAVAIGMRKTAFVMPMIINAPFLFWIVRESHNKPLFVGYITQEDWKNPGSISK